MARDLYIDLAAGEHEPRASNSDLYQIWHKSENPCSPEGGFERYRERQPPSLVSRVEQPKPSVRDAP